MFVKTFNDDDLSLKGSSIRRIIKEAYLNDSVWMRASQDRTGR